MVIVYSRLIIDLQYLGPSVEGPCKINILLHNMVTIVEARVYWGYNTECMVYVWNRAYFWCGNNVTLLNDKIIITLSFEFGVLWWFSILQMQNLAIQHYYQLSFSDIR